jgi:hypothetical protein
MDISTALLLVKSGEKPVSGLSEYRRCESSASHRLKSARCHRLGAPHGLLVDLDLRRFGLGLLLGRHLEHACGDVNRNRDDPRPELVQEDGASAIARIPRVCFDLIFADSWPLSITATS